MNSLIIQEPHGSQNHQSTEPIGNSMLSGTTYWIILVLPVGIYVHQKVIFCCYHLEDIKNVFTFLIHLPVSPQQLHSQSTICRAPGSFLALPLLVTGPFWSTTPSFSFSYHPYCHSFLIAMVQPLLQCVLTVWRTLKMYLRHQSSRGKKQTSCQDLLNGQPMITDLNRFVHSKCIDFSSLFRSFTFCPIQMVLFTTLFILIFLYEYHPIFSGQDCHVWICSPFHL